MKIDLTKGVGAVIGIDDSTGSVVLMRFNIQVYIHAIAYRLLPVLTKSQRPCTERKKKECFFHNSLRNEVVKASVF